MRKGRSTLSLSLSFFSEDAAEMTSNLLGIRSAEEERALHSSVKAKNLGSQVTASPGVYFGVCRAWVDREADGWARIDGLICICLWVD